MRLRTLGATVCVLAACGCARRPCATAAACGSASWRDGASGTEGAFVRLAVAGDARGGNASDRVSVSADPVLLRFDTRPLRGETRVDRAVLALYPHPAWHPGATRVRVTVYAVADVRTGLLGNAIAELVAPLGTRTPMRFDVTSAVSSWLGGAGSTGGIALAADGDGIVLAGASGPWAVRPRVETVVHR